MGGDIVKPRGFLAGGGGMLNAANRPSEAGTEDGVEAIVGGWISELAGGTSEPGGDTFGTGGGRPEIDLWLPGTNDRRWEADRRRSETVDRPGPALACETSCGNGSGPPMGNVDMLTATSGRIDSVGAIGTVVPGSVIVSVTDISGA
jgi:hypothetical protein